MSAQLKNAKMAVIVAALGYFVDIYDLLLFSIVRVASLKDLGLTGDQLLDDGLFLINVQMAGLLIGGIVWGVIGDKKGRKSVLFASIFIYSLANLLNAFVQSVPQYAVLRFIAGIGLAGELGAGVTLVCELLPKDKRGYGTMVVGAVGILGAVLAAIVGDLFHWRVAYVIGGVMGFLLLALRVGVHESGIYSEVQKNEGLRKGSFFTLLSSRKALFKYFAVILVGVPIWFVVGIPVTFSPEFGQFFEMPEVPVAGTAVMVCYIGISLGDVLCGILSQLLHSRKKAIFTYLIVMCAGVGLYSVYARTGLQAYYTCCFLLGLASGYWALFVTVAAEQFGTNFRATAATTAPNFVRGSVIPLTAAFTFWRVDHGMLNAALFVGCVSIGLALVSLWWMEETFHRDLDYVE